MNDNFYIFPHLGLGDQIICHGLIRKLCLDDPNTNFVLFSSPKVVSSVKFMYRSISNLDVVGFTDDESHAFLAHIPNDKKLYLGHHNLRICPEEDLSFDKSFYNQLNYPFVLRWDNFRVDRDGEKEYEIWNNLNLKQNEYIFVHDDSQRNLHISINPDIETFRPNIKISDNIFDYLTVITNAKEIHCMDSCFFLMIDSILEDRDGLFLHINLSGGQKQTPDNTSSLYTPKFKLSWKII